MKCSIIVFIASALACAQTYKQGSSRHLSAEHPHGPTPQVHASNFEELYQRELRKRNGGTGTHRAHRTRRSGRRAGRANAKPAHPKQKTTTAHHPAEPVDYPEGSLIRKAISEVREKYVEALVEAIMDSPPLEMLRVTKAVFEYLHPKVIKAIDDKVDALPREIVEKELAEWKSRGGGRQ
jgi:hypothetical protein